MRSQPTWSMATAVFFVALLGVLAATVLLVGPERTSRDQTTEGRRRRLRGGLVGCSAVAPPPRPIGLSPARRSRAQSARRGEARPTYPAPMPLNGLALVQEQVSRARTRTHGSIDLG